jgi:Na+-driven multidrug efflux pump
MTYLKSIEHDLYSSPPQSVMAFRNLRRSDHSLRTSLTFFFFLSCACIVGFLLNAFGEAWYMNVLAIWISFPMCIVLAGIVIHLLSSPEEGKVEEC